jgi:3-(3-hydroxy-phenyl)propionate hydroxylase
VVFNGEIEPTCAGSASVDVVVAGAGPVGMTAAALLAARGVRVLVLERNATTSDAPKAISLDDEALRVYRTAALVRNSPPRHR